MNTLLCYNLRFCLDAAAADEAEAEAEAEGVRGATADPPLRFRPAVHRACTFPVCVCVWDSRVAGAGIGRLWWGRQLRELWGGACC